MKWNASIPPEVPYPGLWVWDAVEQQAIRAGWVDSSHDEPVDIGHVIDADGEPLGKKFTHWMLATSDTPPCAPD
jgi:hypothetical protein